MTKENLPPGPASLAELEDLREQLRRFLEIHLGTRIVEVNNGSLKMMVMLAKNTNSKIKDKMINYKLAELSKRLLVATPIGRRDFVVCEFLMEELNKYVASKLK
jgi:CxxC motif-containing protein